MAKPEFVPVASSVLSRTDFTKRKEVLIDVAEDVQPDYILYFKRGSNRVITPLEIPSYDELASGSTANKDYVEFLIYNRKQPADSVSLEVLNGTTVIYTAADTKPFLANGVSTWKWDGFDSAGIFDTAVLKSETLKVKLTAKKGSLQQILEVPLKNEAEEVDWIDVKIYRNTKVVEAIIRPSFSDGGTDGSAANVIPVVPLAYPDLEKMAKKGIEHYWSRDGSRPGGIGGPINTAKGSFQVKVTADVNKSPKAANFPLIESLEPDFGRSTSLVLFRKLVHSLGFWLKNRYSPTQADEHFMHTSAHEVGHLILNEYGGGLIPAYSWTHKSTSTLITQKDLPNHPVPTSGEVDVMKYDSDTSYNYPDFYGRSVVAEQDVKGLIWLARVKFNV